MPNYRQLLNGIGGAGGAIGAGTWGALDQYKDEPWVGRLRDVLHPPRYTDYPEDPRIGGYRMGQTVEPAPDEAAMAQDAREVAARRLRGELAPSAAVERRFGAFAEPSRPPGPTRADAFQMGGLAEMGAYEEAPKDFYKKPDVSGAERDVAPDPYMNQFAASPQQTRVAQAHGAVPDALLIPTSPVDAALLSLGPAGKIAGVPGKVAAITAGIMASGIDPAEAAFAGRMAKTANLPKLAEAEQMLSKGHSPNDIWTTTGWFQGADKKWRFEIPDQPAKWNLDPAALKALQTAREPMAMGEAFSHPELMKAYPELYKADFWVGLQPGNARATYSSGFGVDPPTISIRPDTAASMRSSNLHELQHGIQEIEGFATGGSVFGGLRPGTPEWKIYQDTLERIRTPMPKAELEKSGVLGPEYSYEDYLREHKQSLRGDKLGLDRMAQETAMREAYRRSAGEVEARTVQARDRMTPEQMRDIPWLYQDVPTDQQIVKFREPLGALAAPDRYRD